MNLLRVDWNPDVPKIRRFGAGLVVFAAAGGYWMLRRGSPAGPFVLKAGVALGLLTALWPGAGRLVYKAWMSVAFVMGTIVSWTALALLYYLVMTPLALLFRAIGRDALRLSKPAGETYWVPSRTPREPTAFERLF
jgi:hypothetical protein